MARQSPTPRTDAPGPGAPAPGRRRRWWIAAAVVVVTLGGLALTGLILAPRLGARLIRQRIIPALEKRFGRTIKVGRIRGGTTRAVLEDVRVNGPLDCRGAPLFRARRVTVTYAFWPLLAGRLELRQVTVDHPRFCLRRAADGNDNFRDILRKLAERRLSRRLRIKASAVTLRHGAIEARDERRAWRLTAPELDARLQPGGASRVTIGQVLLAVPRLSPVQAREVSVRFRTRRGRLRGIPRISFAGGRLRLHDHLVLTDVTGSVASEKPGWLGVRLQGGYGGVRATLWQARGRIRLRHLTDPRRAAAELRLQAEQFSLDKLAPLLRRDIVPAPRRARLGVDVDLDLRKGKLTFSGKAHLAGLNLHHPYLSSVPVESIGFGAEVRGTYDLRRDLLRIESAEIRRRRLQVRMHAEVLRLRTSPRIRVTVTIPRTRCQHVLDAIPPGMASRLQRLQLRGHFQMRLHAEADFKYLTQQSVYLGGDVDARRCRVHAIDWELSADRLRGPFVQEVHDSGSRFRFEVGPHNPFFVPLQSISPYLQRAILTTEDSRFFRHHGFIPSEFQTALARNLIARRFRYGASSITMQTVKNVLLGRQKTLARKLQELILTWYLEQRLSKERLFEIYLNVIEFGPGLFGVGRAAQHLFGKSAGALEPQEAAYLASILPSPKRHYKKFCLRRVGKRWRGWVDRILRIMHKRGRLSDSELAMALDSPIRFSDEEFTSFANCMARIDRFRSGRNAP